jgi:hypothetical protein
MAGDFEDSQVITTYSLGLVISIVNSNDYRESERYQDVGAAVLPSD